MLEMEFRAALLVRLRGNQPALVGTVTGNGSHGSLHFESSNLRAQRHTHGGDARNR